MAVLTHGEPASLRAGRRRVPWSLVALVVLFAAVVVIQVQTTGNAELETPMFGACFLLLDLLGVALSLRVALSRRLDPAVRRPWRFMVPTFVLHTVSTVGFAIAGIGGVPSVEWVAIAARLATVPFLLVAVLSFPMRRLAAPERLKLGLDAMTVAGGGFIVLWYFIIGPALTSGQPANVAVPLAGFPLGDLVLIFGVCAVLLRGGATSLRHPLTILLAGLSLFLIADVYYSYGELQDRGHALPLGTRLWVLGGVFMMVLAAAQQMRQSVGGQAARPVRAASGVSQLPYAGLATGYLLLLFATAAENSFFPWGGLVLGVIVMTGAVAVRQVIAMRENHKLAVTDSLTGLANRVRLRARLEQVLGRQQPVAVLLIDLDGFKQINDTLGHEAGDTMLVAFARVLTDSVRPSDTASRLGGDEFAVVLPDATDVEQAGVVAGRILAAAATPVPLGEVMVPIRASIGIALARPNDDVRQLLHRADVAMYAAKRTGEHGWVGYTEAMEDQLGQDAELTRDMVEALPAGQLQISFQPVVALSDGALTAVEASVRWEHPTHGVVRPEVFMPMAEQTTAIDDIGLWVLDQTCRQAHQWQQTVPVGQRLCASVKISPHQLQRPDLVTNVLAVVERTGLDTADLVLELTNGAPGDDEQTMRSLQDLRAHGIRIAIDDFDTGYACLRHPTRLPIDILKQDSCFVADLTGGHDDSTVAEAVIRLSRIRHPNAAGPHGRPGDLPTDNGPWGTAAPWPPGSTTDPTRLAASSRR